MTTQRDPAAWPADFGQGRYDNRPGLHLVDTSDHGAAHVCSSITSDSDADDGPRNEGAGAVLVPVMFALCSVACFALYVFLTSAP